MFIRGLWDGTRSDLVIDEILDRPPGYDWFAQRQIPDRGHDGGIEKWIGTSTDTSDLVESRNAVARSESDYRMLFEHAAVGIEQLARNGYLLRANQQLCAMLGYTVDELVGRSYREITLPEDLEREAARRAAGRRRDCALFDR
ncbi:MAG: PAS domain S-box protein [Rhodospirillales bacterium]|nr:PAS domain S-box protein [Rhodospirillales bacterium]